MYMYVSYLLAEKERERDRERDRDIWTTYQYSYLATNQPVYGSSDGYMQPIPNPEEAIPLPIHTCTYLHRHTYMHIYRHAKGRATQQKAELLSLTYMY